MLCFFPPSRSPRNDEGYTDCRVQERFRYAVRGEPSRRRRNRPRMPLPRTRRRRMSRNCPCPKAFRETAQAHPSEGNPHHTNHNVFPGVRIPPAVNSPAAATVAAATITAAFSSHCTVARLLFGSSGDSTGHCHSAGNAKPFRKCWRQSMRERTGVVCPPKIAVLKRAG